jgi:predicted amidohydrolase
VVHLTLAATPAPDIVLFDGKIFTSIPGRRNVQAQAIQGERIEAVGDSARIRQVAGSLTQQIDLGGRTVIPGLNDAHNHMRIRPAELVDLQLTGPNPNRQEVMQAIATAVAKHPAGTFLSATISTAIFRDCTVDRASLDVVAPRHPVILASRKLADLTSDEDAIVELRATLADAAEHGITTLQVMSEKMTPARYVDLLKQVPTPLRIRIMRMPLTMTSGRDLKEGVSMPRNPSNSAGAQL